MQFASAISKELNAAEAGQALAAHIERAMGAGAVDLACLFFSSHYADQAQELSAPLLDRLTPGTLLGCTGEGIIAGQEEIESAPAVTLWTARLPGATLTPWRLSENSMRATPISSSGPSWMADQTLQPFCCLPIHFHLRWTTC